MRGGLSDGVCDGGCVRIQCGGTNSARVVGSKRICWNGQGEGRGQRIAPLMGDRGRYQRLKRGGKGQRIGSNTASGIGADAGGDGSRCNRQGGDRYCAESGFN